MGILSAPVFRTEQLIFSYTQDTNIDLQCMSLELVT